MSRHCKEVLLSILLLSAYCWQSCQAYPDPQEVKNEAVSQEYTTDAKTLTEIEEENVDQTSEGELKRESRKVKHHCPLGKLISGVASASLGANLPCGGGVSAGISSGASGGSRTGGNVNYGSGAGGNINYGSGAGGNLNYGSGAGGNINYGSGAGGNVKFDGSSFDASDMSVVMEELAGSLTTALTNMRMLASYMPQALTNLRIRTENSNVSPTIRGDVRETCDNYARSEKGFSSMLNYFGNFFKLPMKAGGSATGEIQVGSCLENIRLSLMNFMMTLRSFFGCDKLFSSNGGFSKFESWVNGFPCGGRFNILNSLGSCGASMGIPCTSNGFSAGISGGSGTLNGGLNDGVNGGLNTGLNGGLNTGLNGGLNTGLNGGLNTGLNGGLNTGLNGGVNVGLNGAANSGVNVGINAAAHANYASSVEKLEAQIAQMKELVNIVNEMPSMFSQVAEGFHTEINQHRQQLLQLKQLGDVQLQPSVQISTGQAIPVQRLVPQVYNIGGRPQMSVAPSPMILPNSKSSFTITPRQPQQITVPASITCSGPIIIDSIYRAVTNTLNTQSPINLLDVRITLNRETVAALLGGRMPTAGDIILFNLSEDIFIIGSPSNDLSPITFNIIYRGVSAQSLYNNNVVIWNISNGDFRCNQNVLNDMLGDLTFS